MALTWVRNWVSLTALMTGVSSSLYRVLALNLRYEVSDESAEEDAIKH